MFPVAPQDRRHHQPSAVNIINTQSTNINTERSTTAGPGTWWVVAHSPTSCCPAC